MSRHDEDGEDEDDGDSRACKHLQQQQHAAEQNKAAHLPEPRE